MATCFDKNTPIQARATQASAPPDNPQTPRVAIYAE